MSVLIGRYRFLVGRRLTQGMILFLFFAGSAYGWKVLKGNLSGATVFDKVPLADPFALLQILAAGTLVTGDALVGAAVVTLFYSVIGGRAFCGWVCPVNMVTDGANWLRRVIKVEGDGEGWSMSGKIRYWSIGLALVISAFSGVAAFEWISPVSMLHRGIIFGIGFGWAALVAVFLFDLLVVKNGFCGHLCPLGGFYAFISRFSLIRVRHDREKCTSCMKCVAVCPEEQVLPMIGKESSPVLSGECVNCGRCIEVCQDGALRFGHRFIRR